MDLVMNLGELRQKQSLDLKSKIIMSEKRIRDFYKYFNGEVYVAFSGGKDSTVLLDLIRNIYPDVPAVFVDTGLEYPEIKDFVKKTENTIIIRPEMGYREVIKKHGYPVISKKIAKSINHLQNPSEKNKNMRMLALTGKRSDGKEIFGYKLPKKWLHLVDAPFKISDKCCKIMKKKPSWRFQRKTGKKVFIGTMAADSLQRESVYLRHGCNIFQSEYPRSAPLSFWTQEDIWGYIRSKKIPYCRIYDMGVSNTGCIYCMFGIHLDKTPNRFQILKQIHPKLWKYCIHQLGLGKVMDHIGINYGNMDLRDFLKNE